MNRNIVIKKINPTNSRIICISDIHGNLNAFKALLHKIHFDIKNDCLILLGDLIEKGTQSFDTLHYIMNLMKHDNVYCIMGNCDFIAKNILYSYRLPFLKNILNTRKNSLIHEMAKQLNIPWDNSLDMEEFAQILRKNYLSELTFLNDLPHIIEDENTIYAHAGIMNQNNYGNDFKQVMTYPFFLYTEKKFSKPIVVGHMPVTEYAKEKASFNIQHDTNKNIYSIDGGNVVKEAGQLNALILENNQSKYASIDFLPHAKCICTTNPIQNHSIYIPWNHSEITILNTYENYVEAYSSYFKEKIKIDKHFITKEKERFHATDFTTYEMPLKKGEKVSIVKIYGNKVQVKKNGILGWTMRANIKMEES